MLKAALCVAADECGTLRGHTRRGLNSPGLKKCLCAPAGGILGLDQKEIICHCISTFIQQAGNWSLDEWHLMDRIGFGMTHECAVNTFHLTYPD